MSDRPPLRIGILGAARIAPMALIRPARSLPEVQIAAVAARDPERARIFAEKHGIPRVCASYQELVEDPALDAIYNPLPNSLHCEWTLRSLRAGKHVLCEKPIAANAGEAERMAAAAEETGRVLVEAFHWRYHPLAARMREVVRSGGLGEVRRVEASLCIPFLLPGDIRYRFDLAGGATMDTGCYAINLVRFLAEAEPNVVTAEVRRSSPDVDRWMRAELSFADGRSGRVECSLFSAKLLSVRARVIGSRGELDVLNPIAPHLFHRLRVRAEGKSRSERVPGEATYTHQLRAFAAHVAGGPRMSTDAADAVANMRVIDAVYDRAGMRRRGAG
jgi:predicted dehydrogenase